MTDTARRHHWSWLLLGVAVPVLGWCLEVVDTDRVAPACLPRCRLPQVCAVRTVLKVECPACGLTRSIIHLLHGRAASSLATHRLGWLVLLLIVAQAPYRAFRLWRPAAVDSPGTLEARWLVGLAVILLANRLYDLLG